MRIHDLVAHMEAHSHGASGGSDALDEQLGSWEPSPGADQV